MTTLWDELYPDYALDVFLEEVKAKIPSLQQHYAIDATDEAYGNQSQHILVGGWGKSEKPCLHSRIAGVEACRTRTEREASQPQAQRTFWAKGSSLYVRGAAPSSVSRPLGGLNMMDRSRVELTAPTSALIVRGAVKRPEQDIDLEDKYPTRNEISTYN